MPAKCKIARAELILETISVEQKCGNKDNLIPFVLATILSKALSAIAQFYAVYVIARLYVSEDAAVVFLLLGYATWLQMLDLGLPQTLQNRINQNKLSYGGSLATLLAHHVIMWVFVILITQTDIIQRILLVEYYGKSSENALKAFTWGGCILAIANTMTLAQRILLVTGRGMQGAILQAIQSIISAIGLLYVDLMEVSDIRVTVILYIGPQVLIGLVIIIILYRHKHKERWGRLGIHRLYDFLADWSKHFGLVLLSSLYIGMGYHFAARYLQETEVIAFHMITRIFFVSYVIYYSALQFKTRNLSSVHHSGGLDAMITSFKESIKIGLVSVLAVLLFFALTLPFGIFEVITGGIAASGLILSPAALNFLARVPRDVFVVFATVLDRKFLVYSFYAIELVVGISLLETLAPKYGAVGIFAAMCLSSLASIPFIIYQLKAKIIPMGVLK